MFGKHLRRAWISVFLVVASIPLGMSQNSAAEGAAQRAVEAAKKYAGTTLTVEWQAGLQALDPLNYSGPMWEQLTGIKIKVVEVPLAEVFSKIALEQRSATAAYDVFDVVPAWTGDLVQMGALEPLDAYIEKFGYRDEVKQIAPVFRDNWMTYKGKTYALPDDGDVLILYYRKDIFANPELKRTFREKYSYDLAPPKNWKQFAEVGSFLSQALKKEGVYGASMVCDPAFAQYLFQERFRNEGGTFFDSESMRAAVNSPIGIRVMDEMRAENRFMPPGVENFNFAENLAVFLNGASAMTISWPPVGRWAAGYGTDEKALAFVPKSKIAGKVGYALPPGGHPELAIGHSLTVASSSKNKEAAYLFIQWLNSEAVSAKRVQLPYTLRDPFRTSHYANKDYQAKWQDAPEYLALLKSASELGLMDLSLIQTDKYEEALRQAFSRLWAGEDPKTILNDVATQWDSITQRVGVERQKLTYQAWASKPGAYPH